MSAPSYNRGSRVLAREIDALMPEASRRADRAAEKKLGDDQRRRILELERDLARARRCIAELRRSKEAQLAEARAEQARSDAAIRLLTRIAFGCPVEAKAASAPTETALNAVTSVEGRSSSHDSN